MLGMTILGAAISGGFFDEVQAMDFIARNVFHSEMLAVAAHIAGVLALAFTIVFVVFKLMRKAVRLLHRLLMRIEWLARASRKYFWRGVACGFRKCAKLHLVGWRWALAHAR